MKKIAVLIAACFQLVMVYAQPVWPYQENKSYPYQELIDAFKKLHQANSNTGFFEFGKTDIGYPLHVFTIGLSSLNDLENNKKPIFLINNSIHAGESCGSDAAIVFANQLLKNPKSFENVVVAIIPVYNIGGYLNRSPYNRSNQNGHDEIGFRGNYQNLDLNRDFIKADAQNTLSFYEIFHKLNPHVYLETHTTNGSEHQYTLTAITPQKEKLNPALRDFVKNKMEPEIFAEMKTNQMEVVPYVYSFNDVSESIMHFYDSPRYSTGYTNLFNTIGFISEAHKYKPYKDRVEQTLAFMHAINNFVNKNHGKILEANHLANQQTLASQMFYLNYQLDTTVFSSIPFKGYETVQKISNVSGKPFKSYDLNKPYLKTIKYFDTFEPYDAIVVPTAYVIPQSYSNVIERLRLNNIDFVVLKTDTQISGEMYYIKSYETVKAPYEKHYLHEKIVVSKDFKTRTFFKGDVLVFTNQVGKRFLAETLEPHAIDSYFAWNFFDNILQRKEWFSSFKFEETAEQLLNSDPKLKVIFEDWKKAQEPNNLSHYQIMEYVYNHSPYREESYKLYPIMRIF